MTTALFPLTTFTAAGLTCHYRQHRAGFWCGYVEVPAAHAFARLTGPNGYLHPAYERMPKIRVAGGITYRGDGFGVLPKQTADALVIGWDTGRAIGPEWTVDTVRDETARLAAQVAAVTLDPDAGRLTFPLAQGVRVVTLQGEADDDDDGERRTPVGAVGIVEKVDHHPDYSEGEQWEHWVGFPDTGATVIINDGELADRSQYVILPRAR